MIWLRYLDARRAEGVVVALSLGEKPTAAVFEVEDLIRDAWAGKIRIPEFQRPLRWGFEDVRRLFESMLREYPLGSLLLWARPAESETLTLGALKIDAPKTDSAVWVVDGQQRITSLANALSEKGSQDPRFAVSINVLDGSVVRTRPLDVPTTIPVRILFDSRRLLAWFRDHPDVEEHFDAASDIATKIRRAKIPASIVTTPDVEVLRDIFDRMNSYGKRLTRAEVFSALHPGEGLQSGETSIESIAESIEANQNFGSIDGDTILAAVLARRGADITREIRIEFDGDRRGTSEFPDEDAATAYAQAQKALSKAIGFLVQDADVPHFAFLPYRYLLTVLTRVFAHHDVSGARERRLLRRWFWRAAATGPSTGATTGTARLLCSQVVPGDLNTTLTQLLDAVPKEAAYPDVERFRTNYATGKTIACAMWSMRPRSIESAEQISREDLAAALELGNGHTPREALTALVSTRKLDRESEFVGRWLLNPGLELAPAEAVATLIAGPHLDHDADTWDEVLASHGITPAAEEALSSGHAAEFVRERTGHLGDVVRSFLDVRWEFGFENIVSVDNFVIDDLEGDDEPELSGEKLNSSDARSS